MITLILLDALKFSLGIVSGYCWKGIKDLKELNKYKLVVTNNPDQPFGAQSYRIACTNELFY